MQLAAARRVIDFRTCDDTARWWIGARMLLEGLNEELSLTAIELDAHRAIAVQGMTDLGLQGGNSDYRQQYAIDAVERFQCASMPWIGKAKAQNTHNDQLDQMAAWYAYFGDKLGPKKPLGEA